MKKPLILIAKISGIILLTIGGMELWSRGLYFSAVLLLIGIVGLGWSIWSSPQKAARRMEQMIAAIRYGDLNISFPETARGEEGRLVRTMNEALAAFRERLYQHVVTEAETEAWQKLIRVLTHEIMNSLAPIISLSETVTERASAREPDEKEFGIMLEAMQSIRRRSSGLLEFVENYRKLTRIPIPVRRVFPAEDLFLSLEKFFSADAKVPIVYRIHSPGMRLHADRALIEQVLINLIKNALEATGGHFPGEVRIEASELGGNTTITVSDNGNGIVPEAMERIFVPFYTTKPGGSGIGLSLSRQIISRHNGTITASSSPDTGSVFTIRIPGSP